MTDADNKVTYIPDYRSPPSGCGTIVRRDGSLALIQEKGCMPKVLDNVYQEIFLIGVDIGEEYKKGCEELTRILKSENVEVVCDPELSDQHNFVSPYMDLDKYLDIINSYC